MDTFAIIGVQAGRPSWPLEGYLLTDEHNEMLEAIRARDVERADALAHAHTRQFRDSFIAFMKETYTSQVSFALEQTAA